MCIYYKEKEALNYTSQDHILPAAIGGILKLPKGYVSDEFNNDISKLERELTQKGLLKMPREIQGPGKRGNLSDKKATKSEVHVIKAKDEDAPPALGYIKLGKAYEISYVYVNLKTDYCFFSVDKSSVASDAYDAKKVVTMFKERCEQAETLKVKVIIDKNIPEDVILFGIQDDIERNYNAFFVKHETNSLEYSPEWIRKLVLSMNIDDHTPQSRQYKPLLNRQIQIHTDHLRIYGKMAFNYLAHLKGKEYVLRSEFDTARDWIAKGSDRLYAWFDNNPNPLSRMITLPDSYHMILPFKKENILAAKIYTYGGLGIEVCLCKDFKEKFTDPGLGFMCDWKNRREFTVAEYIALLNRQAQP